MLDEGAARLEKLEAPLAAEKGEKLDELVWELTALFRSGSVGILFSN